MEKCLCGDTVNPNNKYHSCNNAECDLTWYDVFLDARYHARRERRARLKADAEVENLRGILERISKDRWDAINRMNELRAELATATALLANRSDAYLEVTNKEVYYWKTLLEAEKARHAATIARAENEKLEILASIYQSGKPAYVAVALLCDKKLDKSGELLGKVRELEYRKGVE